MIPRLAQNPVPGPTDHAVRCWFLTSHNAALKPIWVQVSSRTSETGLPLGLYVSVGRSRGSHTSSQMTFKVGWDSNTWTSVTRAPPMAYAKAIVQRFTQEGYNVVWEASPSRATTLDHATWATTYAHTQPPSWWLQMATSPPASEEEDQDPFAEEEEIEQHALKRAGRLKTAAATAAATEPEEEPAKGVEHVTFQVGRFKKVLRS